MDRVYSIGIADTFIEINGVDRVKKRYNMQKILPRTVFITKWLAILPLLGIFFAVTALLTNQATVQTVHAQVFAAQPAFSLQAQKYDPTIPATKYHFMLNVTSGTTLHESVLVANVGTAAGVVNVYPVSATTSQNGGITYLSEGAKPLDVAAWMVMAEQQLTLAPGQSRIISFQIVVPHSASIGQHFGGIAAAGVVPSSSTQNGAFHVNIMTRHIMSIQMNLPGALTEDMAVTGAKAGGANGYQQIILSTANTGNTELDPTGELKVYNSQGQSLQDISFKMGAFLPDTNIDYPVNVQNKALAAGDYQVVLDIKYGHQHTLHYTTKLTISAQQVAKVFPTPTGPLQAPGAVNVGSNMPVWQVALIGILVLFGVLFVGQNVYRIVGVARRKREKTK